MTDGSTDWPQPYRLPAAAPYWEALADERLTFQRCCGCHQVVWPAHSQCPNCASPELQWETSTGQGTVYSYSTVMRGPTPVWAAIVPYTVGFVEMDEGYHMFAQIDEPHDAIEIRRRVTVSFVQRGAQKLPIFSMSDSG